MGVESLVCHPATMTHAAVDPAVRESLGIDDGLVRFSLGCENTDDLIADVTAAQPASGLPTPVRKREISHQSGMARRRLGRATAR